MALSKTITHKGITVQNAYHKVTGAQITKVNMSFDCTVFSTAGAEPLVKDTYFCAYDLKGDNPIKQAYEHLKTLPEFFDAEDV
jgi:hypothetical protein